MRCSPMTTHLHFKVYSGDIKVQALMSVYGGRAPLGQDPLLPRKDLFRMVFSLGPPFHWKITILGQFLEK